MSVAPASGRVGAATPKDAATRKDPAPRKEAWFAGESAIVVGATGGLGSAICSLLAARGAQIYLLARDSRKLQACAESLPTTTKPHEWRSIDVHERDELCTAVAKWSAASILVNSAGVNFPGPVTDLSAEQYETMMSTNVDAVFWASRAFVESRSREGRSGAIVNISSQMGTVGAHHRVAYCATKHAVEGMTKAFAVELAADGWRVNAVAPTFVETELTAAYLSDPDQRAYVLSSIPQGRLATASDVAAAVAFLASTQAQSITGTTLLVDGGWVAK